MKINKLKTKVMVFNTSKTVDVLPEVVIEEDTRIEVVEEIKLIGVMVTNDMEWQNNTNSIIGKCYAIMWMLRNLKKYGADEHHFF